MSKNDSFGVELNYKQNFKHRQKTILLFVSPAASKELCDEKVNKLEFKQNRHTSKPVDELTYIYFSGCSMNSGRIYRHDITSVMKSAGL